MQNIYTNSVLLISDATVGSTEYTLMINILKIDKVICFVTEWNFIPLVCDGWSLIWEIKSKVYWLKDQETYLYIAEGDNIH